MTWVIRNKDHEMGED